MGTLILDASLVIGLLDSADAHHQAAVDAVEAPDAQDSRLVAPASAYSATLVAFARTGRLPAATGAIGAMGITVAPLPATMAERAAELRARHRRLRLPAAIVWACAGELEGNSSADRRASTASPTNRAGPSPGRIQTRGSADRERERSRAHPAAGSSWRNISRLPGVVESIHDFPSRGTNGVRIERCGVTYPPQAFVENLETRVIGPTDRPTTRPTDRRPDRPTDRSTGGRASTTKAKSGWLLPGRRRP